VQGNSRGNSKGAHPLLGGVIARGHAPDKAKWGQLILELLRTSAKALTGRNHVIRKFLSKQRAQCQLLRIGWPNDPLRATSQACPA
jgi:hypothetical protein